ncbi:GNAT family N-acetyltransferase [Phenylobacterium sp.]|uniref:GNAT family N-acetyltransferase n=1 Tax=Phenylobacterium sp. TaxID=1871053 RepID=UPI0027310FEE|nr:GNAT family N-acetyltransferase [Phenylobacterium sp.]MDP1616383.1 GNAT family N-acetyltransferase [Phenylobacterium sp.]MDP1987562.1 GNAT family N-acetyltransferase [Phenylobacterium sp.]
MILTSRTRLRPFEEGDREAFAALVRDSQVMADQGGPMTVASAHAKLDGYRSAWKRSCCSRMALETHDGIFLGYVGIMEHGLEHPIGPHHDIGWRLVRTAWGLGYATEAARAVLTDAFSRLQLKEVLAYTEQTNAKSLKVMQRLNLARDPSRDFVAEYKGVGAWRGLVWSASPEGST